MLFCKLVVKFAGYLMIQKGMQILLKKQLGHHQHGQKKIASVCKNYNNQLKSQLKSRL